VSLYLGVAASIFRHQPVDWSDLGSIAACSFDKFATPKPARSIELVRPLEIPRALEPARAVLVPKDMPKVNLRAPETGEGRFKVRRFTDAGTDRWGLSSGDQRWDRADAKAAKLAWWNGLAAGAFAPCAGAVTGPLPQLGPFLLAHAYSLEDYLVRHLMDLPQVDYQTQGEFSKPMVKRLEVSCQARGVWKRRRWTSRAKFVLNNLRCRRRPEAELGSAGSDGRHAASLPVSQPAKYTYPAMLTAFDVASNKLTMKMKSTRKSPLQRSLA